ncbi:MAG: hypothetical protein JSV66_02610 [Trueperaceae bacterium]|nr:MAG: hypothetical protein JSV66_02610 [Trueperaceae bacterium]
MTPRNEHHQDERPPGIIGLLFSIASRLAPNEDSAWVEEMEFEVSFIPGRLRRYGWAIGTLRFASMRRIATLRWRSTPGRTALATSLAIAAVVGFSVFFPQAFRSPFTPGTGIVVEQQSLPETEESVDAARFRRQELAATPPPSADTLADDIVPDVVAEAAKEVIPASPAAGNADSVDPVSEHERSLAQAAAPLEPAGEAVVARGNESSESSRADASSSRPSVPQDLADSVSNEIGGAKVDELVFDADQVEVVVVSATHLKVIRNTTDPTGQVLLERKVMPGETFVFALPVRLSSDDAGALTIVVDGVELGSLGNSGATVELLFTRANESDPTP